MTLSAVLYGYETWSVKYRVGLVPNLDLTKNICTLEEATWWNYENTIRSFALLARKCQDDQLSLFRWVKQAARKRQDDKVGAKIFIMFLSQSSLICKHGFRNPDTELHKPPSHTISMPAVSCVRSQCMERLGEELLT